MAKQVLEKEVTCSLCLDIFKEPKKLPCDHVYCKNCLHGLALRGLDGTISCPECRSVTNVPNMDISGFPTASYINRLVQAFQETREEVDRHHREDAADEICMVHKTQPLALYCETCKTMLCRDCVIMTKKHTHHKFDYIENVAKKYRENHEKRLQMTKEFGRLLSQVQPVISEVDSIIVSEEAVNQEKIDHAFEDLHKVLEKGKQSMKKKLSQKYQSVLDTALEKKGQIENLRADIAHITALVEAALEGNNEALFTQEKQIESDVKKLQKQIELLVSTAAPSLQVPEVMSSETLEMLLAKNNFFYSPADPTKCKMVDDLKNAIPGQRFILSVKLVDSTGSLCLKGVQRIEGELHSIRNHTTTAAMIERHTPCNIGIQFTSPKRGRNEVRVTVRGQHISNSPRTINFLKPISQFDQPVTQIGSLERPAGLTSCGNNFLAVEYSRNRICKYNTSFQVVAAVGAARDSEDAVVAKSLGPLSRLFNIARRKAGGGSGLGSGCNTEKLGERAQERDYAIGQDKLKGPIALTTDQQMNIYVSTVQDHKVHKFKCNGEYIISTGSQGTLPGQFNFPMGVRISSRKELYVCDSRNNRIQVFDQQLKFKEIFGGKGAENGQSLFQFPTDVDFDSSGDVYICDGHNFQIQVFTPSGQFIRFIGTESVNELQFPLNLCIFNDLLYVTQSKKDHIMVLKTTGELVKTFGQGVLQQPEGIEVDADGYVYVSSHHSKIFVF